MDYAKLSGPEKAAVLLLCLGEEASAKVFEELSDSEVRIIGRCMMNMSHIPADVIEKVFLNFRKTRGEHTGVFFRGSEFTKKAISSSGNQQRVNSLMDQVVSGTETNSLETISMMEPRLIASLLEHEHPQTLALILSIQNPDHTGKILGFFSEEMRSDIMYRISRINDVSQTVIGHIEEALQKEIGQVVTRVQQQVGGLDKVVEILGKMEKGVDRNILIRMEETDPEMAEEIRKKMFTFEDMLEIDNDGLQQILKEVNTDTLTLALKTATEDLKTKIFNNISRRAAEMIEEDLEVMGPTKLSEVEAVQMEIVKIALRLEDEGSVILPGRGGRDILV